MSNPAGATRYAAMAILCLAELLVVIDNTIINIALPAIGTQLGAGFSGLQWCVDAYTLTFAGFLLAAGTLGDRYGRRRVLYLGMVGFAAMSVVAATSDRLAELVGARAAMGVFAAAIFPATLALVTTLFTDRKERSIAIGVWAGVAGIAIVGGPLVSGWLLEHFTWHSVFWINLPVAAIAMAGTALWVPEAKVADPARLDIAGVVLSIAGIALLVWAIIEAPRYGWTTPITLTAFAGAACALTLFVLWQLRVRAPLLDVRLFKMRRFAIPALSISVAFFALFGFVFFFTLYFQAVRGYSAMETGVRALPYAVGIMIGAPIGMALGRKLGTAPTVAAGLAALCGGFVVATFLDTHTSYAAVILPTTILMGAGLGLVQGPATELLMSNLAEEDMGVGAAINDTTREVGGALGVAVLGSVLSSSYAHAIAPAVSAAGIPEHIVREVNSSPFAGLALAEQIPSPQLREQAVTVVRDAFVDGIFWTAGAAALATGVGALLTAALLPWREGRQTPAAPEPLAEEAA